MTPSLKNLHIKPVSNPRIPTTTTRTPFRSKAVKRATLKPVKRSAGTQGMSSAQGFWKSDLLGFAPLILLVWFLFCTTVPRGLCLLRPSLRIAKPANQNQKYTQFCWSPSQTSQTICFNCRMIFKRFQSRIEASLVLGVLLMEEC